ncbi:glycosyltransferase family 2 protein [Lutimonas vermicola]|uniref:Glycosyltransferase family 2 protein n=1 Tax=Lutimonas vermicola TaxID=414288 RepID=A0ABU9L3Y6_9FLAO
MQQTLLNKTTIPFISIILPCYNEEAILEVNVNAIINYLETNTKYKWEIVIVDDGSNDKTGEIADNLENNYSNIKVIHHPCNLNLGRALQTGFCNTKGDIIVVMDIDLSYSVEHIGSMVDKIMETSCDMVLASPYMKGGKVTNVPFLRKVMSLWLNRFMRFSAQQKYHTYTGMVRAYKADFIRNINLKTTDYEINPEIMYKAMIVRARIIEIPAHLDWTEQNKFLDKRTSSIRIIKAFFSGIMAAFIFRPYIFFLGIGSVLMFLSLFELIWLLIDTLKDFKQSITLEGSTLNSFSLSLAKQFANNPQTFIVGGITFLAAIQMLSLGFLSLQSKRYFEELFHLSTSIKKNSDN